jgi:hypothetical protein
VLLCLQAHAKCRQLKQQLLHVDRDLSKAGGCYDAVCLACCSATHPLMLWCSASM